MHIKYKEIIIKDKKTNLKCYNFSKEIKEEYQFYPVKPFTYSALHNPSMLRYLSPVS